MTTLFHRFWTDEQGLVLSAELILIVTILVLGLIVGLVSVQAAVVTELTDVGASIGSLNQSYSYSGFTSFGNGRRCAFKARTFGSLFVDRFERVGVIDLCGTTAGVNGGVGYGGAYGGSYGGGGVGDTSLPQTVAPAPAATVQPACPPDTPGCTDCEADGTCPETKSHELKLAP